MNKTVLYSIKIIHDLNKTPSCRAGCSVLGKDGVLGNADLEKVTILRDASQDRVQIADYFIRSIHNLSVGVSEKSPFFSRNVILSLYEAIQILPSLKFFKAINLNG